MGGSMRLRNKKTGEIKSIEEIIRDAFLSNELDSLKNIDANWEDVDGTNDTNIPLIKNEKIRKAVRAWAVANGVDTSELKVSKGSNNTAIVGWVKGRFGGLSIDFETRQVEELEDGKKYTIEELCGEEEE